MGMDLLPVSIIPVFFSAIIVWIYSKPFKQKIKTRAILEADKNAAMYESINGISTIKGLATEDKAYLRIEEKIVAAAEKGLELDKLGNFQRAIQDLISGIGTLALYWVGSFMIFDGKITLGQLISFNTLSGFFLGPLKRLLTMQLHLQEIMISAERLTDIIDMEEECPDEENLKEVEKLEGDIQFKNVTFSYGTRGRAVEDVSLIIPAGKKVAFVGTSGSGKTTLLRLLAGRIRPASGMVTGLAGKRISMVFQEDRLLPWRTALENVALVREGSEADARDLLSALGLASEADQLPAALSGTMTAFSSVSAAAR